MEKNYNFVYITTNLINGKQYVGSHGTNKLDDSYVGSGVLLNYAIKKYGKENFKREIILTTPSIKDSRDLEEPYIKLFNTLKPFGYNISLTGGIFDPYPIKSIQKSANSRRGVGNAMYGRSLKDVWSEIYTPQEVEVLDKAMKEKQSKALAGRKYTIERCKNIRKGRMGQIYEKINCPHCNKDADPGNYKRWHGNKCKYIK